MRDGSARFRHARRCRFPADVDDSVAGPLIDELFDQLRQNHVDHTSLFRRIGAAARGDAEPTRGQFVDISAFEYWTARWNALNPDAEVMDQANPVYIPRDHLLEEALTTATGGDMKPLEQLLDAVATPYDERRGLERYAAPRRQRSAPPTEPSAVPDAASNGLVTTAHLSCGSEPPKDPQP